MTSIFFTEWSTLSSHTLIWGCAIFVWVFLFLIVLKYIDNFLFKKTNSTHVLRKDFFQTVANISLYSCFIIALFFASLVFPFVKTVRVVIALLFIVAVVLEISALLKVVLRAIIEKWFRHQDNKTKKNVQEILTTIMQIVVWVLAVLMVFDTIGIAITPILTSLGIWWVAIAFAAQKFVEDFFSSFSIMGSTPFRIGDFITVAWYSWTVKKIGLRSTTLQTIEGAEVIIPNRSVVADVIDNQGMIKVRRKRFYLTITYETQIDKLKKIPELLKEIINKQEKSTFEWAVLKELLNSL